jgi:hypothetical protein
MVGSVQREGISDAARAAQPLNAAVDGSAAPARDRRSTDEAPRRLCGAAARRRRGRAVEEAVTDMGISSCTPPAQIPCQRHRRLNGARPTPRVANSGQNVGKTLQGRQDAAAYETKA